MFPILKRESDVTEQMFVCFFTDCTLCKTFKNIKEMKNIQKHTKDLMCQENGDLITFIIVDKHTTHRGVIERTQNITNPLALLI